MVPMLPAEAGITEDSDPGAGMVVFAGTVATVRGFGAISGLEPDAIGLDSVRPWATTLVVSGRGYAATRLLSMAPEFANSAEVRFCTSALGIMRTEPGSWNGFP